MILLDTNVLSGLMQHVPDQQLVEWLDDQPGESIWTTAITVFEVRMGLELKNKKTEIPGLFPVSWLTRFHMPA